MLEVLRTDESLQIDEILELLETQLTSSEVFTALFELEMAGRVRHCRGRTTCGRCKRQGTGNEGTGNEKAGTDDRASWNC